MKVLLIEDDAEMADYVVQGLAAEGYLLDAARTGPDGLRMAIAGMYEVIIVDRMLPGMDGLSIVKELRSANIATPVIYLTTMSGISDRVDGLNAGGDDYLVKPFALVELVARVRALARRPPLSNADNPSVLRAGELVMDLIKRTVTNGNTPIELLPQEFRLLEYFMRNQGRAVTRSMLLGNVWDIHFDPRTSVVESHISRLRSKIDPDSKAFIQTVRNVGYILRAPK